MYSYKVTDFLDTSLSNLEKYLSSGGKAILLEETAPKGTLPIEIPPDVIVTDLRYGGISHIKGRHPRIEGIWTAYANLTTGLARNFTYSQTITDSTPIEDWKSSPYHMQRAPAGMLASEEYRHLHNHHQLLHSEVFNFSKDLNGIAFWGDSAALAPGARSWGSFISARSWPVKWSGYTPENLFDYDAEKDFDASLIGLEIDIINGGKDWPTYMEKMGYECWKVGLQIVGFGARNTSAIEIRTEDTDDKERGPQNRRGAWMNGILFNNSLHEHSTVLGSINGQIKKGIDFDRTTFTEGAFRIASGGKNSGIIFDGGYSGEIYSITGTLHLCVGKEGFKVWSSDGQELLMEITDNGVRIAKLDAPPSPIAETSGARREPSLWQRLSKGRFGAAR